MEHDLNNCNNLNVVREPENDGDVRDSTTLLNLSEGEGPTMNNVIVSEAYNASLSSRRSFDHYSEDNLYVTSGLFELIYSSMFSSAKPIARRTGIVHRRFSSDQL